MFKYVEEITKPKFYGHILTSTTIQLSHKQNIKAHSFNLIFDLKLPKGTEVYAAGKRHRKNLIAALKRSFYWEIYEQHKMRDFERLELNHWLNFWIRITSLRRPR